MELYKKYRPGSLGEYIVNTSIDSLTKFLSDKEKCPHTFLFKGVTGCGKTTLARIVVKELNIQEVIEINSADFRGIDTIREIRQSAGFMPVKGDSKAFIIDEVHELSYSAMDAILKLLEETPSYLYFILCTTNPEKLLPAIRNRCSTFNLVPLTERQLILLLKEISEKEKVSIDREIFKQIYKSSEGIVRDALQILQQVMQVSPDKQLEIAKKIKQEEIDSIELCRALMNHVSWGKISSILEKLKSNEPEQIRRHILGYCQSVLLNKDNHRAGLIMEEFIEPFYNSGFPGLIYACYAIVNK